VKPPEEVFEGYDREKLTIATLGSHSALQILKGARDQGFRNLIICEEGKGLPYRRFKAADEIVGVSSYRDIMEEDFQKRLAEKNVVIVPHGSLIEYVGARKVEKELRIPILGNRHILEWESNRDLEREWLKKANIRVPRNYGSPEEIDRLCIIKFSGARGGRGYFLASTPATFHKKARKLVSRGLVKESDVKTATIQEYISHVNMYLSYFYSPLNDEVELFGIDKRYETNIDTLTRVPAEDQIEASLDPSYVVVGNLAVVARESLLPRIFEMGDSVVEVSKKIAPPGMLGPFCLETIVNDELEFIAFEISARIVGGTNIYSNGSPYTYLQFGRTMNMGERIALELKNALDAGKEDMLIT